MKTLKNTLAIIMVAFISINVNAQEVIKKLNETAQKEGCISGDCKNGFGAFIYPYGDKYIGNWKDGKLNGQGTWINTDKSKTVGNWENDFQNGVFEVFNADGSLSHKEVWVKGKGLLKSECEGNCENGWGTYVWEDGNRYEGNWKNGKKNGGGNLYFINGDTYFGNFLEDIFHENGTYTWSGGNFYKGEYKNGKMNGKGKYYNKDRILERKGTWIDDEYQTNETGCISGNCENGTGTYLWENGQKYEGEWKDGKMDGTGTLYLENGEIYHNGQWKNHEKVD